MNGGDRSITQVIMALGLTQALEIPAIFSKKLFAEKS